MGESRNPILNEEYAMKKSVVFSAILSTAIAAGVALAPAAFADDMKKDTMSKNSMSKDGMKSDAGWAGLVHLRARPRRIFVQGREGDRP
jgi:hypothetical protein